MESGFISFIWQCRIPICFLAIPITIILIALGMVFYCLKCCEDCCNKVRTHNNENSSSDKNNTPYVPSVEEQREEPFDENN